MPDDGLGAQTRWRPGRFLGLNDLAYAHGGRIVVGRSDVALATDQEPGVKICSWCKGSRRCAFSTGFKRPLAERVRGPGCANCASASTSCCELNQPSPGLTPAGRFSAPARRMLAEKPARAASR
jgi:hypothetical protein